MGIMYNHIDSYLLFIFHKFLTHQKSYDIILKILARIRKDIENEFAVSMGEKIQNRARDSRLHFEFCWCQFQFINKCYLSLPFRKTFFI